jgi:hypothetical protein
MADNSNCSVCVNAAERGVLVNKDYSNVYWSEVLNVSEASIRRHYKHGPDPKIKDVSIQTNAPTSDFPETVEVSSNGARSITGVKAIRDRPVTLQDARDWIESSGDNPDDFNLSIRAIAYGTDQFSNKMSAWPKPKRTILEEAEAAAEDVIDPVAILAGLRVQVNPWLSAPAKADGEDTFVISLNDTQFGKKEGGGTPATLERLDRILFQVQDRIAELNKIGRKLGTLVILGGGDIVEGCVIYPNQSYSVDLDRRGQINTAVSAILDTIDRLAPMFTKVIVLATRGNHGENRIGGHRTTLYDNDDTLVFEMAKQATDRDPTLAHVEYIIANDEAGVWVDTSGWRLATTHGDIYGRGGAGTSDKKAQGWMKSMSLGRDPLGSADVLIGHHFHHYRVSDWGACLFIQTPALDGGSEWFRQSTGQYSAPGMLTFVMTPKERVRDQQIITSE